MFSPFRRGSASLTAAVVGLSTSSSLYPTTITVSNNTSSVSNHQRRCYGSPVRHYSLHPPGGRDRGSKGHGDGRRPKGGIKTESNRRPPAVCLNIRSSPTAGGGGGGAGMTAKPESFAHTVSCQKNPNPLIDTPMRVYQSKEPSLMPQIHSEDHISDYMFRCWRRQEPSKVACVQVETGEYLTYGELLNLATHCADVLFSNCKVRRTDTVLLCMNDTIHYPPIAYGVMNIGATLSTTNIDITDEMLASQIIASQARVVITGKACLSLVQHAGSIVRRRGGHSIKILLGEMLGQLKATKMPDYHRAGMTTERDDVVLIPFSAGTTGDPKGVQLTNYSLSANIHQAIQTFGLTSEDVQMSVMPFFHITGFTVGMSAVLAVGGTLYMQAAFDVRTYVEAIRDRKATVVIVTPPLVAAIVRYARKAGLDGKELFPALRVMRSTGAPLSPALWSAIQSLAPYTDVGQIYCMTEMSPLVANTPVRARSQPRHHHHHQHLRKLLPDARRRRTTPRVEDNVRHAHSSAACSTQTSATTAPTVVAGVLVADTELRIVKVEDSTTVTTTTNPITGEETTSAVVLSSSGVDVDEGDEGEVWVSGPQRMLSYVNPTATRDVLVDGWYRTGDIGYVDNETGQLCITDRLGELIVTCKGSHVSPAQLEELLQQVPEVATCVVFGVPDPTDATSKGELARAMVALAPGALPKGLSAAEQASHHRSLEVMLMRFVDSHVPEYKRLHGGIRIVCVVPRDSNGKLMRRLVRQSEINRMAAEARTAAAAGVAGVGIASGETERELIAASGDGGDDAATEVAEATTTVADTAAVPASSKEGEEERFTAEEAARVDTATATATVDGIEAVLVTAAAAPAAVAAALSAEAEQPPQQQPQSTGAVASAAIAQSQ